MINHRILSLILGLMTSTLSAQEPLAIPPGKVSKYSRSGLLINDFVVSTAEVFKRTGLSSEGLLFDRAPKSTGGGHGLGVWDPRTFEHLFELWQGTIVRPGPGEGHEDWDYRASNAAKDRDRELREEFPKIRLLRYLKHVEPGFETWPEEKRNARVRKFRRDLLSWAGTDAEAERVRTDPSVLKEGMGTVPFGGWANYYAYVGAISPDLKSFYLSEDDETREPPGYKMWGKKAPSALYLVDMVTGERKPTPFQIDGKPALPEEISPDLKYAFQFGFGGSVQIFDNQTHQLIKTFAYPEQVQDGHFSPDSKRLVVYGYGGTCVWDLPSGKLLASIKTQKDAKSYQPEWAELDATGSHVWIYHLRKGYPVPFYEAKSQWPPVAGGYASVKNKWVWKDDYYAINPDYQGSFVWDVEKDREVRTLTPEQANRMEGFGPLPGTALLGADDHLQLVDLNTGKTLAKLMFPEGAAPKRQYIFIGKQKGIGERLYTGVFEARALSRPDGLVLGAVQIANPKYPNSASFHYVNWELGPHLEELRKKMAETPTKKSWW